VSAPPLPTSERHARADIERLAARAGFAVQWQDAHGRKRRVQPEMLAALLAALGLPCTTRDERAQSFAALDAEHSAGTLPPLITAQCHSAITLPAGVIKAGSRYRLELESGEVIDGRLSSPKAQPALLAPITEPGYHWLTFNDQRTCLAVAPTRCHTVHDAARAAGVAESGTPALWGVAAQLYGLRRTGDGGIGDFTALAALATQCARRGAHAVAISPVHAMFSADPHKYSPYSPSSRLCLNVAHIDPAAMFGADALRETLDTLGAAEAWANLEARARIDWPHTVTLRLAVLRALFERFCTHDRAQHNGHAARFEAFRRHGGHALEDHARFEALDAWQRAQHGHTHWRAWAATFADHRSAEVNAFADEHRHEIEFHLFAQWLAAAGLANAQQSARDAGMAIGLIADLAVGCDGAGSHAWSYRDDMLEGVSVGAPPDLLNQAGQAWGLTTFCPRALRNEGFTAFIDMLRAAFSYAGGLRIDHVLGLQRLWLVPEGAPPADGAYLAYPFADLLRLIALESWRHRAVVIGEDLGTVPPGFRDRLAEHGLLGMRVLWFERKDSDGGFLPPAQWGASALAMTTTHDLPTVAGWWQGRDIAWRHRIGQTAPRADGRDPAAAAEAERTTDRQALWRAFQEAGLAPCDVAAPPVGEAPVDEALLYVSATPAPLVVHPLEDLLGLPDQPNLPGSIDEYPNWRHRAPAPADALFADAAIADRMLAISRTRADAGAGVHDTEPPSTS
jgi:4-alpha-glucanotransferase